MGNDHVDILDFMKVSKKWMEPKHPKFVNGETNGFGVQFQGTLQILRSQTDHGTTKDQCLSFNLSSARSLAPKTSRREQTSKDQWLC
jgi:hypothetical protein